MAVALLVVVSTVASALISSASMVWPGSQSLSAGVAVNAAVNVHNRGSSDYSEYRVSAGHSHGPPTVVNVQFCHDQTYYVLAGNTPVLVHNCGDAPRVFAVDSAGETTIVPVHQISASQYPGVFGNFQRYLSSGGSPLLNRLTGRPNIVANRNAAQAGLPRPPAGMSWEEAPFASTTQGGAGATTSLVPLTENVSHGRDSLWPFYRDNGVGNGDPFLVRLVP